MSNSKTRRRREIEMARAQRQAERRVAMRRRRQRILAIIAAIVAVVVAGTVVAVVLTVSGGGSTTASATPSASATPAVTTKVGDCVYTKDTSGTVAKNAQLPAAAPTVSTKPATMTINTNYGTMVATLDPAKAPCTVHALYSLAQSKYFDNTTCHRETYGPEAGIFVLQCGDPTASGQGTPGFKYKNENTTGVNYSRGVLAMANAGADTNGSQFFINYANPSEEGAQALAGGYTVFGQITQGLDVLDKITGPGVVEGGDDGEPVTKPQITSITINQEQPAAATPTATTPATTPAATTPATTKPSASATS